MTLDVIKSKAQTLMIENNGLEGQYQQLIGQVQKLRQSVDAQQYKNEQMNRFIKERHGRTDQQTRIEELAQIIKTKKKQARIFDEQLGNLQKKKAGLDRKIQLLKYTISDIELHQQAEDEKVKPAQTTAQSQADDQLAQLRKRLEDENKQEVLLENEQVVLKTSDKSKNLNVDLMDSDTQLSQASARMYDKLRRRKEELEMNIHTYELRMDALKQSSLTALSWPLKRKRLIHEMVQIDTRNNQMQGKIKVLREDIGILKDQIARLERRVDFVKGPGTR